MSEQCTPGSLLSVHKDCLGGVMWQASNL